MLNDENFVSNQSIDLLSKQLIPRKMKEQSRQNVIFHCCLRRGKLYPFLSLNNDVLSCFRWDESMYTYCHPERIMFFDFTLGVYFERR